MPAPPRFSICIPNFNNGGFLAATIESVLAQTYENFEIVVSDNASTDDSLEVARSYEKEGVRLVTNPQNLGLAANFDRVADASIGRHLLLLSADDVMYPTALERYAAVLDDLGSDADNTVLISAYDTIDADGTPIFAMHRPKGDVFYRVLAVEDAHAADTGEGWSASSGLEVLADALQHRLAPAPFVTTCYPRRLLQQVGGYRSGFRAWPDTHFVLKLLSEDPLLVYLPERLFAYRVHRDNQFASFDRQRLLYYQVDSYLHTTEFPAAILERVGVERSELVRAYISRAILGRARRAIANGAPGLALRYLAFGLATHPQELARRPEGYATAALAVTGPAGRAIARRLPEK